MSVITHETMLALGFNEIESPLANAKYYRKVIARYQLEEDDQARTELAAILQNNKVDTLEVYSYDEDDKCTDGVGLTNITCYTEAQLHLVVQVMLGNLDGVVPK